MSSGLSIMLISESNLHMLKVDIRDMLTTSTPTMAWEASACTFACASRYYSYPSEDSFAFS